MARMLGNEAFGSFTFGLSFAALVTVLAGFGQDAILTREVARDRRRVDEYFANTLALKLVLALPVLRRRAVADSGSRTCQSTTRVVAILITVAVLAELLTTTCFAVFQAYERLGFLPVVIISQRLVTAARRDRRAWPRGAGHRGRRGRSTSSARCSRSCSPSALLFRRVVRPRREIDDLPLVAADAGRAPGRASRSSSR